VCVCVCVRVCVCCLEQPGGQSVFALLCKLNRGSKCKDVCASMPEHRCRLTFGRSFGVYLMTRGGREGGKEGRREAEMPILSIFSLNKMI